MRNIIQRNNNLNKRPIEEWIKIIEKGKAANPDGPAQKVTCKYLDIDVTGGAAVAKIELYRGSKKIFTDYLSLYKFNEGWKVASKIYQRH